MRNKFDVPVFTGRETQGNKSYENGYDLLDSEVL